MTGLGDAAAQGIEGGRFDWQRTLSAGASGAAIRGGILGKAYNAKAAFRAAVDAEMKSGGLSLRDAIHKIRPASRTLRDDPTSEINCGPKGPEQVTAGTVKSACEPGKECFPAGTRVLVVDDAGGPAYKNIEDVREGDEVFTRDHITGEPAVGVVERTFVNRATRLHTVKYRSLAAVALAVMASMWGGDTSDAAELEVTPEHPFAVVDETAPHGFVWKPARELKSGDRLHLSDGTLAVIESNDHRDAPTGRPFTTYNFEVRKQHTYFVAPKNSPPAAPAVWVHNECGESIYAAPLAERLAAYKAWRASKGSANIPTGAEFRAFVGAHREGGRGVTLYRGTSAAVGGDTFLHGNSSSASGLHDVYVVRDLDTGELLHFGETGRGLAHRLAEHQRTTF